LGEKVNRIILENPFQKLPPIVEIGQYLATFKSDALLHKNNYCGFLGPESSRHLMSFLMRGFNEIIAREIAVYLMTVIQPGLEWLVKLTLFIHSISVTTETSTNQDELMGILL